MNKRTILVAVVLCAALIAAQRAVSQDKDKGQGQGMQQPNPEAMQAMMQKWMATINPGPQHKTLDQFVGSWNTTTKMWWGGPGSPAEETKGTSEVKWVLGKRFLMEEHRGEMLLPDENGQMKKSPYEGLGLTGYDNARNLYFGSWASNMQTNLLTMQGGADPSGKVFRMYGEMDETMLGVVGRTVKYVTRIVNDDKHVFEIIDLHAGDDYKVIEITYTRK